MTSPDDRKLLITDRWWEKLPRTIYSTLERVESHQEWFEVYQIKEGIYSLYEPGQYEEALSTLLVGEGRSFLIDTGCGIGNIRSVVEELTDQPVTVLNTHSHNDHIAQNYLFDEIWMLDHPWSVDAQKGLPMKEMEHLIAPGMVWKPLPKDFDSDNYVVPGFRVTKWFRDGEVLDLKTRKLEVIHTPGHTPDSCCFLDREDKMLFTGDMFYTGGIYTYLDGGDVKTFIKSYEKMLKHYKEFELLMPSHNEPCAEKKLLREVYNAVVDIDEGKGSYREGTDRGVPIRKYEYGRFSIVTRVE
jgi:glyoxylase-like metal-dependent hydrolase (beta-lactamase superfamily II)